MNAATAATTITPVKTGRPPYLSVSTPTGASFRFEIDAFRKHCLLNGLDDIGLTLQHVDEIKAYEERRKKETPWLFN